MLYQTQQHIHTLTLTSLPLFTPHRLTSLPTPLLNSHLLSMEPVVNALKSSFINQMSHKPPLNDYDITNATHFNVVASDEFSVDDLLDFSKINGCEYDGDENESTVVNDVVSVHSTHTNAKDEILAYRNGVVEKEASDFCVPTDDVADLEWLSHFVEDSEYSLTWPVKPAVERLPVEASGKPTKAAKARTKRARNGVLGQPFSGSETTSSASSSTTSFSSVSTWFIYGNQTAHNDAVFDSSSNSTPLTAAMVKRRKFSMPLEGNKTAQIRRCSHCGVQKTPQWRAGPLGVKTLCNACGVRFKSGRLFPEYRPACSPTFSSKIHSNNHRKVLEMRQKKEVKLPESGRVPAVSSF